MIFRTAVFGPTRFWSNFIFCKELVSDFRYDYRNGAKLIKGAMFELQVKRIWTCRIITYTIHMLLPRFYKEKDYRYTAATGRALPVLGPGNYTKNRYRVVTTL